MRRTSKRPIRRNPDGTREHPTVIEKIDDVDAFLAAPGHYQTTSTFPAYAVAKALDGWHPLFKGGMDMPFVEGNIFFFQVLSEPEGGEGIRPNAYVRMGVAPDHWVKLLDRYTNWEIAWWREVAQNSRDASATQLDFDIKQGVYVDPETGQRREAMVVSAYDNGGGMSAEVLRKALLTVSGSHKTSADPSGGFGDAKNLILFPWLGWKVQTNRFEAEGHQDEVREETGDVIAGVRESNSPIQGTRVTVWMEMTRTTTEDHAKLLLGRCYLPTVRCRVNGKDVAADLTGGEVIAEREIKSDDGDRVGKIQVRYQRKPKSKVHGMYIRGRGIYMFEESIGDDIPGVIYVDADAPARFVFESNRNTLIDNVKWWIEGIKRNLAKDPDVILRSKKWNMEKIYEGTGALDVRKGRAAEVAARATAKISDQLTKRIAQKKAPSKQEVEELVQEVAEAYSQDRPEEVVRHIVSSRDTASKLVSVSAAQAMTVEQVATAVRYAMWQPDFLLINQIPFWKPPPSIEPETMEAKYVVLLRAWAEACKFGLNVLGEFKPFGVGFCMFLEGKWGKPVRGGHQLRNGMHWLMVCPFSFKQGEWVDDAEAYRWTADGDLLDLSTDAGIEELCSVVVHEITHLQGFSDHDTSYASALTQNMKIAHRGLFGFVKDQIKTIKAETRARFSEIRQEKIAVKTVPWDVVVGRVTAILEWWDGLFSSGQRDLNSGSYDIENLAREAGRNERSIKESVVSLLGSLSSRRELSLKPKLIVKLHDEALAAGAFKLITEDEAKKLVQVWQSVPPDPRVRTSAPEGVTVFSWTRSGKDWVLREGFAGQRGAEVMRYEGGTSNWDRMRQRDESVSAISSYLMQAKKPWPGSENLYVWLMTSGSEWLLRVKADGRPVVDTEDADIAITVNGPGSDGAVYVFANGFPGLASKGEFGSVAEAQRYVLDGVVRQRAGG